MADSEGSGEDLGAAEDAVFGDWGPSLYNEGEGIRVKVVYLPIDKDKNKRRKNAKPLTISKVLAMHEDYGMSDFLVALMTSVGRLDLLESSSIYRVCQGQASLEDPEPFSLTYTVSGTSDQDIELATKHDYEQMLKAVIKRKAPQLVIKLTELVSAASELNNMTEDEENDDARQAKKKKGKQHEPSAEEVDQNEIIEDLQGIHGCEDNSCASTHCFPCGPDATHVKLTPRHFRQWAAAISAKADGVDRNTPPNDPLFDIPRSTATPNTTDVALLANRRLRAVSNTSNTPNVHMSFDGLADFVAALKDGTTASSSNSTPAAVDVVKPAASRLPPRMALDEFCTLYFLSESLVEKLRKMELVGPHVLRKLSDHDLVEDGALTKAQIAELRDAEERWLADNM